MSDNAGGISQHISQTKIYIDKCPYCGGEFASTKGMKKRSLTCGNKSYAGKAGIRSAIFTKIPKHNWEMQLAKAKPYLRKDNKKIFNSPFQND